MPVASEQKSKGSQVPADVRERIAAWCAGEMADSDYPLAHHYPDIPAAAG